MIETFTPEDKGETDSAGHKLIRAATKAPITEDDIPFTTKEIREAIKGMDKTKALREDRITSDILHCAFILLPTLHNGTIQWLKLKRQQLREFLKSLRKSQNGKKKDLVKRAKNAIVQYCTGAYQ
jgi:hypothetical protein